VETVTRHMLTQQTQPQPERGDKMNGAMNGIVAWPRIDPRRVHVTGFSNGGFLASILARRHPRLWASVTPVAGYDYDAVLGDTPVPLMMTHGLLDTSVNPLGCCEPVRTPCEAQEDHCTA
jgi:poly(3-hydroxybutyrate) depolymerase